MRHRNRFRRRIELGTVLLLGALIAVPRAGAEERNVRFETVALGEGRDQILVRSMLQDRQGRMWFATPAGLTRFDGTEGRFYSHDPGNPETLSHDKVRAVHQDRKAVLWVATAGGGLDRYDPATDSFRHYSLSGSTSDRGPEPQVQVILDDGAGRLWLGTDSAGLVWMDPATRKVRRYRFDVEDPSGLKNPNVRDILRDRQGRLWIGTDGGGVSRLDPETEVFTHFTRSFDEPSSLGSDRVRVLYEDRHGAVWVGTDSGLSRWNERAGRFENFRHDPEDPTSLSANGVWAIHQDRFGTLWVGTDAGLNEWVPERTGFVSYRHDPSDPYSLGHDGVVSILEDRGGVLWVGTLGGLNKWSPLTAQFRHFKHGARRPNQLSNGYVTSFAEAEDVFWIGTYGGGLNRFDRTRETFETFISDQRSPGSLSDDRVVSLLVDHESQLWVGTFGGGLSLLEDRNRFSLFDNRKGSAETFSEHSITRLFEDSKDAIWVATFGGGLHRIDADRASVTSYRNDPDDPTSLSSDQVFAVLEDRERVLWVGTKNGGLNRFDTDSGTFESFNSRAADPASLSGDTVLALAEDRSGDLWIGTEGDGLNRWRAEDRRASRATFERYTRADGLRSSTIFGIQIDGADQLWISSDAGLARFDPTTATFTHYDTSHGLQSNDFNFGASFRARDGQMLFGGVNGFNAFYPSEVRGNQHVPPVVLTSFSKFNQPVEFGKPLEEVGQIALGHKDSVIGFQFAALDYTAPQKNRYRYLLEGFDEKWVEAGTTRRATYTNLAAGDYVFRVQGSNNDGVWNAEGASIRLSVAPPPWKSWWAYLVYALMAAGAVALFGRAQRRKKLWALELAARNRDLTLEIEQRREKEAALEREKRKAQRYLDVAEVIMLVVDTEGTVTLVNPKGCAVLGCEADEIVGKRWVEEFVSSEGRPEAESTLRPSVGGGYSEYSVVTRGGDQRIIAWHTAALTDDSRRHIGTLCSGSDITDMRRLAAEKATAESATKAKSQFLANVSHEIRTPLNGVLGMIELLSNSSLTELQRRFAETAAVSAKNLMAILNDVLDFSKIEAGKLPLEKVTFDLRQVVEEVGALFAEAAHQKGLELLHFVPADVPTELMGDPTRLRQILSNLVGNAIKFTSEGEIAMSLEVVSKTAENVHLCFEVRDTGIGIDERASASVFESFHQADQSTTRRFGGTGLGLAISKQLVELLGGEIGVQSEAGSGSVFWFTLPLLRSHERLGAGESARRRFDAPAPKLLVVDDNESSRAQVSAVLEGWGAEVRSLAESSAALLELLEASRSAHPYDALVVDHYMKEMDGLELARAVKAQPQLSTLPVVLMANTSIPSEEEMERSGISSYLVKPVRLGELFGGLARALGIEHTPVRRLREHEQAELLPFHVLVAEDNQVNQEVIGGMLSALGGTADFVANGREAVNAFVDGRYDLVFMDCQMPVMDGYGAARAIREHERRSEGTVDGDRQRVPIVALTANALGDDRRRCVDAGMDNYLSKPCGLEDLRRALNVYLPSKRRCSAERPAPLKAVPPPDSGGINREVFEKIRELGGARTDFVEKVVTTYLDTSPELVEGMASALSAGDAERLADLAHTLKSSSASLGAEQLAALCRRIERLGREGLRGDAAELVGAVREEFERITATLTNDYLAKSA